MRILLLLATLLMTTATFGHSKTHRLSIHTLDTYAGVPGEGIKVEVYKDLGNDKWKLIDEGISDHDGRINDFLKNDSFEAGIYRIRFFTHEYCKEKYNQNSIYPYMDVVVELESEPHYHIPISISPFGYGTYKGR